MGWGGGAMCLYHNREDCLTQMLQDKVFCFIYCTGATLPYAFFYKTINPLKQIVIDSLFKYVNMEAILIY